MISLGGSLGCQEPTEAIVEISTDAACADVTGTGLNAGLLGTIEKPVFDTTTSLCETGGHIGSIVLVPEKDETAPFAFKIVTSIGGDVNKCSAEAIDPTCIVARRGMRFVPNTPFNVPVPMRQACAGVACPTDQTCVDGICKSATVDPASCIDPASGCDLEPGDVPPWQKQFEGAGTNLGRALAINDSGLVALAGSFDGELTLGGESHRSSGLQDVFLATYAQGGMFRWSAAFGGAGLDEGLSVAIGAGSDVYLLANFQESVDFGAGPVKSAGATDVALVKFMSTGKLRWAVPFGGSLGDVGTKVAVGPNDETFVVGSFSGKMTIGTKALTSKGGADAFVASFSPKGDLLWATSFGGTGDDYASGAGADAEGRVYVAGSFDGEMALGGNTPLVADNVDAYVASFDGQGAFRWAKAFGSPAVDAAHDLAARDARVVVTGQVGSGTSIDGVPLGAGDTDGFVAAFSPDGKLEWGKAFGTPGGESDRGSSVSIAKDGSIALGGESTSPVFDALPPSTKGAQNPFVALLEANGSPRWARSFGTSQYASMAAVAASPHGSAFVTGWFTGGLDSATDPLMSAGLEDIFLYHVTAP
ncbi:MAG: PQQ-like beta-propeller repeat protein [Polyangiaceae bacterium]|nr:PQQ-like beta-propeller repeat protein [Polyangiaceae bacterium]